MVNIIQYETELGELNFLFVVLNRNVSYILSYRSLNPFHLVWFEKVLKKARPTPPPGHENL